MPEFLGSTSANASRFLFAPTLGRTVAKAGFGGIGSAGMIEISGHPVAGNLGASKELRSDQAGSARGAGEREGEVHAAIFIGDDEAFPRFGEGLFGPGDFGRAVPLVEDGDGLLAGRALWPPAGRLGIVAFVLPPFPNGMSRSRNS